MVRKLLLPLSDPSPAGSMVSLSPGNGPEHRVKPQQRFCPFTHRGQRGHQQMSELLTDLDHPELTHFLHTGLWGDHDLPRCNVHI